MKKTITTILLAVVFSMVIANAVLATEITGKTSTGLSKEARQKYLDRVAMRHETAKQHQMMREKVHGWKDMIWEQNKRYRQTKKVMPVRPMNVVIPKSWTTKPVITTVETTSTTTEMSK